MNRKRIALLILCMFLLFCITGCANKTGTPARQQTTGVVLMNVTESNEPPQSHEMPNNTESEPGSIGSKASEKVSDEQLRSAKMGLEAFRLFCVHFKLQADQTTLNSIQKPTLDYIRKYIDPILHRTHPLQDDDYSRLIIEIYYIKAYLYWIFDDVGPAREMVAQIQENLPEKLRKKTINQFDQGEVTIEDALHDLENLLSVRSGSSKGVETD
ncbi:MAG: hypothetical protein ABIK15_08430 [Pseudomonadota bacterium]